MDCPKDMFHLAQDPRFKRHQGDTHILGGISNVGLETPRDGDVVDVSFPLPFGAIL